MSGSDRTGSVVLGDGDVDGDGGVDFLLGAPGADAGTSDNGLVYLVHGDVSGTFDLSSADARFLGSASGDGPGDYGMAMGDADGDGLSDILIGAPGNDNGTTATGAAYLLGPRL